MTDSVEKRAAEWAATSLRANASRGTMKRTYKPGDITTVHLSAGGGTLSGRVKILYEDDGGYVVRWLECRRPDEWVRTESLA